MHNFRNLIVQRARQQSQTLPWEMTNGENTRFAFKQEANANWSELVELVVLFKSSEMATISPDRLYVFWLRLPHFLQMDAPNKRQSACSLRILIRSRFIWSFAKGLLGGYRVATDCAVVFSTLNGLKLSQNTYRGYFRRLIIAFLKRDAKISRFWNEQTDSLLLEMAFLERNVSILSKTQTEEQNLQRQSKMFPAVSLLTVQ